MYLIGQDFHTNFIIAMIEFRYSTLLADSFNAKEYDYYITSIRRDQLRVEAKKRIEEIQAKNRRTFNNRRKEATTYKTGDLVAIEGMQDVPGLKLQSKYI